MVQFASYVRRVLHKTRLIFSRINGPIIVIVIIIVVVVIVMTMIIKWSASSFNMPSTPGQNVHLVVSQIHAVASSSHLANSSSQLVVSSSLSKSVVESSCRLVESSRRVVESSRRVVLFDVLSRCNITRLFFNSSYYLSTRRVTFQLFVQRSRALFLGPKGPGYHN